MLKNVYTLINKFEPYQLHGKTLQLVYVESSEGQYNLLAKDTKEKVMYLMEQGEVKYATCKGCGKKFPQSHGLQQFCPPTTQKQSKCRNTYNQRIKRLRQKLKEITM